MKNKSLTNSTFFSLFSIFRKFCISLFLLALPVTFLFAGETPIENEMRDLIIVTGDSLRHFHASASVVVLTEADFNKGNYVNIWQLIQGRAPGMWITVDGGAPGAMGTSSLLATTSQPLIVVDGLPQDPRFAEGMRDPLNFLNTEDIESITLLTDAASTSLYGGRGGNGVILIRTKRAQQGDPFSLEYSTHFSAAQPGKQVDVLDAATFRFLVLERFSDQPELTGRMGESNTSWQDEIYSNTFSQSHHLSASGNVAQIPWRAAFHFNDHAGVLNTDNLRRLGGRLNLNPSLLDDHLRININLHTSQLENRIAPHDAIDNAIRFDPTQPVRDPESIFGGYFTWTGNSPTLFSLTRNPVAVLNQTEDFSATQTLGIQVQADYALHFFPDITLGVAAYQQTLSTERQKTISDQAAWSYLIGGVYTMNEDTYSNRLLEGRINFNRHLSAIDSRIALSAAISRQDFNHEYSILQSNLRNNLAGEPYSIFSNGKGDNMRQLESFTFGAGYAFKDLYFLDYNFRNDRSSLYNPDNPNFGYHSLAAAWKMHNESFWPEGYFLSQLKISTSVGQSGRMDFQSVHMLSNDLQPEQFNSFDATINYGLWENRLTGHIRYFDTEQSEGVFPVPRGRRYYSLSNIANINHKGWEFSLYASPVKSDKLSWDIGAHLTTKKNQVTEVYGRNSVVSGTRILREGYPANSFNVYQLNYSDDGVFLPNDPYVDQNNDGIIDSRDMIPFKSPDPDLILGFSSHFRYGKWRLSMAGTRVSGNYVYNQSSLVFGNYDRLFRDGSNITTEALQHNFASTPGISDYYVQDASYLRMDFIDLTYNLTTRTLNLEISATVQNAFVITHYPWLEPEVPSGMNFINYPRPRMFTMGVMMGF